MNYLAIIPETTADGDGYRTSIYISGCHHHCKGCHNPQSWDFKSGSLLTMDIIDTVIANIKKNPLLEGITFSGGDPLAEENAKDLIVFLKKIKSNGINVWCYTGYTYEYLLSAYSSSEQFMCLNYIDMLVDGQFVESLKDPALIFRGSSNQRILDIARINGRNKIMNG